MGLFIIFAIIIALFTLFGKDGLIDVIKNIGDYNAEIERKIKYGYTRWIFGEGYVKYDKSDYRTIIGQIFKWMFTNIGLNVINAILVLCISVMLTVFYPYNAESQYSFNINALEDNLVTSGRFYGRRGTIDGELSYFFSRTMSQGEKIGHIPANKTYIVYNEESYPNIEVHQKLKDYPDWLYKSLWIEWINDSYVDYYVLTVPKGTISNMENYEIDMK